MDGCAGYRTPQTSFLVEQSVPPQAPLLTQKERLQIRQELLACKALFCQRPQTGWQMQQKQPRDWVTEVDQTLQDRLSTALGRLRPDIAFLGEEGEASQRRLGSQPSWILDPLDGTSNFIFDRQYSCISLALWSGQASAPISPSAVALEGGIVSAFLYNPYADELFEAHLGEGCFCNGRRLQTAKAQPFSALTAEQGEGMRGCRPEQWLLAVSSAAYYPELAKKQALLLDALRSQVLDLRISGSSALNLSAVASGRASLLLSPRMQIWDFAAGLLLVQEAGLRVCTYEGQAVDPRRPSSIVAGSQEAVAWGLEQIRSLGLTF